MSALLITLSVLLASLVPAAQAADKPVALITGANRGIGLELARQLGGAGYTVIGTARNAAEAQELQALGAQVEALDVTDPASVQALAQRLKDRPIDLLINNAGVGGDDDNSIRTLDVEAMAGVFDVNSLGPLRVTQALLPNLQAGKGRTVVQITSVLASIAENSGGLYGYRASKTALNMFNSTLAVELGSEGFLCVVLHPGWVQTRMGGTAAPVTVADSAAGLVKVISALTPADNGRFLDYQGKAIAW